MSLDGLSPGSLSPSLLHEHLADDLRITPCHGQAGSTWVALTGPLLFQTVLPLILTPTEGFSGKVGNVRDTRRKNLILSSCACSSLSRVGS